VILQRTGFSTALASDGEAALFLIDRERPDAVVLDLTMPGVDGWSVLEAIVEGAGPPVVVCSARGNLQEVERAVAMGAFAFIAKPFDLEALVLAVCRATGVSERSLAGSALDAGSSGEVGSGFDADALERA
jgi:DNA-binding response OmpR family regulator